MHPADQNIENGKLDRSTDQTAQNKLGGLFEMPMETLANLIHCEKL